MRSNGKRYVLRGTGAVLLVTGILAAGYGAFAHKAKHSPATQGL